MLQEIKTLKDVSQFVTNNTHVILKVGMKGCFPCKMEDAFLEDELLKEYPNITILAIDINDILKDEKSAKQFDNLKLIADINGRKINGFPATFFLETVKTEDKIVFTNTEDVYINSISGFGGENCKQYFKNFAKKARDFQHSKSIFPTDKIEHKLVEIEKEDSLSEVKVTKGKIIKRTTKKSKSNAKNSSSKKG